MYNLHVKVKVIFKRRKFLDSKLCATSWFQWKLLESEINTNDDDCESESDNNDNGSCDTEGNSFQAK